MTETVTATSQAGVPYPMTRAILATKDTAVGVVPEWNSVNDEQRAFLDNHYNPTREEAENIEEIESVASDDEKVVNAFLQERGFSIELEPLGDDEYGMAAVLDYPWKWSEQGDLGYIGEHRSILLSYGCSFYKTPDGQILVRLETQTDDVIWLAMEDNPETDYGLVIQAQNLQKQAEKADDLGHDAVTFPAVDLDLESQVIWLIEMWGLNENGQKAKITQALQQTKLRMNDTGGRCESAAAVAVSMEGVSIGPENPYIIDKPFLLWLERPSLSQPLFALHLCEDVWKMPENLD